MHDSCNLERNKSVAVRNKLLFSQIGERALSSENTPWDILSPFKHESHDQFWPITLKENLVVNCEPV